MARYKKPKHPDLTKIEAAETQIRDYSRTVKFTVTEYSFEFIMQRLKDDRYYVPEYQRNLVWTDEKKSKFVESIFMGLPIPFVFFWQDNNGRMEIVDGSQRLRTIRDFMSDKLVLKKLHTLPAANGFRYSDFPHSRQLKFAETSIRVIILDNATDALTRTEMFARINTGGQIANEAEIRRGSLPGPFMDMIKSVSASSEFERLTPISKQLVDKREREELVTRFFAYLESYDPQGNDGEGNIPSYKEEPRSFYFKFVENMNSQTDLELSDKGTSETIERLKGEFFDTLKFVEKASVNGFTKSTTGKQVPRVRFESIAVGTALALREKPELKDNVPDMSALLETSAFLNATKSDAANVRSKLLGRIRLVKNWLIQQ